MNLNYTSVVNTSTKPASIFASVVTISTGESSVPLNTAKPLQIKLTMKPKRVRLLTTSRHGCFTCKSRHIKCDEEKPGCLRCARSGRVCEGYQQRINSDQSGEVSPTEPSKAPPPHEYRDLLQMNPARTLRTRCITGQRQYRFVQLGLELLSFDSFSRFGSSRNVLEIILPQLCYSDESVSAAAAAVGSSCKVQALHNFSCSDNEAFAASQYQCAINAIRRDLLLQPQGPIPLILICFMLSMVEIFLQREENALFHLGGASKLLQYRRASRIASSPGRRDTLDDHICSSEDEIVALFRTVDFQTSSYALSKPPELSSIAIPLDFPDMADLKSAHVILVQLVHACYDFTFKNYKFKYQQLPTSASIQEQQARLITHLYTWLKKFELNLLPIFLHESLDPSRSRIKSHALILRMTTLSALIHLCCIVYPYERGYDAHEPHFLQIIADGEAIIAARHSEFAQHAEEREGGQRFSVGPGIVQPLFMTAYKYRHPLHRRRAIHLLSLAGREGPWHGPREACVTSRIMALEENYLEDNFEPGTVVRRVLGTTQEYHSRCASTASQRIVDGNASTTRMAAITEAARIHGMGMRSEPGGRRPSNNVHVRFSRSRAVRDVLSYRCEHGIAEWQGLHPHSQGPCVDNPYWEIWTEVLEF